jgi:hypothetical protein
MPTCPDRDKLILEWRESVSTFSDNVKRLAECTGNGDWFLNQFYVTDLARKNCEEVHNALKLHRTEHGC